MSNVDARTLPKPEGRSRWAADPDLATRRHPAEDQGRRLTWRGSFERDRDRLLHARAFRRLAGKTQLLAVGEGRQVRTRLTHTLEISAAARTLARHLSLNEDLAEAIALAHELGQPPFGNAGARSLHELLSQGLARLAPRGMGVKPRAATRRSEPEPSITSTHGFDAGTQALRVIDLLEVRYAHPGLNLTDATREGLFKLRHGTGAEVPAGIDPTGLRQGEPPPLEAECVRAAWLAMTPLHDVEDMLSEGFLELRDVLRVDDAARVVARLKKAGGWPRGKFRERAALHRALVHATITDVLVASQKRISVADAAGKLPKAGGVVAPSRAGAALVEALRELLEVRVLTRSDVRRADSRAARTVEGIFVALYRDPLLLDDSVLLRWKELSRRTFLRDLAPSRQAEEIAAHYHGQAAFARLLADHIAGMTDRHAEELWQSLSLGRSAR